MEPYLGAALSVTPRPPILHVPPILSK